MNAAKGVQVSTAMVMNMVDVASLGPDLVEIRRPRLKDRSVNEEAVREDEGKIRFVNIFLVPLLFVAFGLVWWLVRAAQTFVPSPRQPVTVPAPAPPREPEEAATTGTSEGHS